MLPTQRVNTVLSRKKVNVASLIILNVYKQFLFNKFAPNIYLGHFSPVTIISDGFSLNFFIPHTLINKKNAIFIRFLHKQHIVLASNYDVAS